MVGCAPSLPTHGATMMTPVWWARWCMGAMIQDRGLMMSSWWITSSCWCSRVHETTATVLAWAMLHLAAEPACWHRLCDEANGLGKSSHRNGGFSLCTVTATGVFREALRLYPPVANTIRKANDTLIFDGHTIAADTIVACNLHEISRDPTRYPQPNKFLPSRWLSRPVRPTPLETCQFGGGPHFCLGYHVAMLEGVALLVSAAQRLSNANKTTRTTWPASTAAFPSANSPTSQRDCAESLVHKYRWQQNGRRSDGRQVRLPVVAAPTSADDTGPGKEGRRIGFQGQLDPRNRRLSSPKRRCGTKIERMATPRAADLTDCPECLALAPLLYVAWADGELEADEIAAVKAAAARRDLQFSDKQHGRPGRLARPRVATFCHRAAAPVSLHSR